MAPGSTPQPPDAYSCPGRSAAREAQHGEAACPFFSCPGGPVCVWFLSPQPQPGFVDEDGDVAAETGGVGAGCADGGGAGGGAAGAGDGEGAGGGEGGAGGEGGGGETLGRGVLEPGIAG